ncbi:hypothetical protein MCI89_20390 [Muricomes sp. OA1]|uniref:hypothetical protein n=1 Tax=Lachnospiraceae TaxID=186803 RepID=UPI00129DA9C2|nr:MULTISPECIES: hypothetical protein [Lachnospiraceae]MCH1974706.1 hypothetical protein [Muricomes sp. OA1]MRM89660.1 hypothetical protein [Faecalicatena contorta]GKH33487.1 hypothetical protein CE91St64_28940 [Faecalicatena contorta]
MKNLMKLDLQHFAESAGSTELPAGGTQQTQTPPAQQTQELAIDYEKLAQIVQGKQSVAEDSALRGYLKQQGLSKEQMDQAITTFKQQQAANTPDVNALQAQAAQAQADAQQAQIQAAATMAAVGLGIDAKTIPYVLKMADLSQVMGEDGKINDETLKTVLNKVLEDVPALKPAPAGQTGFVQVGASGGSGQQQTTDDALKKAFGL